MAIFKGAGVAIVTPMKDNQDVNYDKLEELINQQIDAGTDAIVIAGTTGESSTLTIATLSRLLLSLQNTVFRLLLEPVRTAHAQQSSCHRKQKRTV